MLSAPIADPEEARRRALRCALRSWRSAVNPRHVAALPRRKRRGPGLSREDVAELAGLSLSWYTLFEGASPKHHCSPRAVERIADALGLSNLDRAALQILSSPAAFRSMQTLLQPRETPHEVHLEAVS
jgi:Helix-turn-helix domain